MGERYKKVYFRDFRGGANRQLNDEENGYYTSENVKVAESGSLELAPGNSRSDIGAVVEYIENPSYAATEEFIYLVVVDNALKKWIYRAADTGTFSLIDSFTNASWDAEGIAVLTNGNYLRISGGAANDKWSDDNGDSFSNTGLVTTAYVAEATIQQLAGYLDGYCYIPGAGVTKDFGVWRSKDLVTWELVIEHDDGGLELVPLFGAFGFMHITDGTRIFRIINGRFERVHYWIGTGYVSHQKMGEGIVMFHGKDLKTNEIVFREWDGEEFKTTRRLPLPTNIHNLKSQFYDGKSAWLTSYYTSGTPTVRMYRYEVGGKIFPEGEIYTPSSGSWPFFNLNGNIIGLHVGTDNIWEKQTITAYAASGTIESRIADCDDMVPKMLIVRHRPLAANESVTVYFKKNKEASYSSALITSDTDDAVKKAYTFPNGTAAIDFAQVKITLAGPGTTSPQEVDCVLLGVPRGMINAK